MEADDMDKPAKDPGNKQDVKCIKTYFYVIF